MAGKIEFPEDSKNRAGAVKWTKNGKDFVIPVANGGYVKDLFSGNSNLTKSYEQPMNGFSIFHGGPAGSADTTFKIGAITGTVKAQQSYDGVFEPYTQVAITSSQPFQAEVRGYEATSVDPPPPEDTTPPSNVSSLTATNITQSSVTLNWAAATDNVGVAGYDIYRNGSLVSTVVGTTYNATGLAAATEYLFMVRARDEANNVSSGISVPVTTSEGTPGGDTTPPVVTASPAAGTYSNAQNVTLTANEAATIYYTTNGIDPTEASSVYSTPIPISANTTLKYFGKDTAGNKSAVQTAAYTIDTGSGEAYVTNGLVHKWDDLTNQVALTNDGSYFPSTTDFTICATLKSKAFVNIMSQYNISAPGESNFRFHLDSTGKRVNVIMWGKNSLNADAFPSITGSTDVIMDTTSYYHIVAIRNATTLKIIVNDVLYSSFTIPNTPLAIHTNINANQVKIADAASDVKNVLYYSRELNTSELTQNYNALK